MSFLSSWFRICRLILDTAPIWAPILNFTFEISKIDVTQKIDSTEIGVNSVADLEYSIRFSIGWSPKIEISLLRKRAYTGR